MKYSLYIFVLLSVFASCSLLESARRPLMKQGGGNSVPKEQYDKLMKNHMELSKKYKSLVGESPNEINTNKIEADPLTQPPKGLDANIDSVDVFAEVNKVQKNKTIMAAAPMITSSGEVDKEIELIKRAIFLKNSGKQDQALKILQALETSTVTQVKVRAKYYIGEILLEKRQYDLAMQSFESIVNNYAFSGFVVDSLRHLVTCTDQLGIVDKKQKYLRILKDVFGSV